MRIQFVEIQNFRKLKSIRIDFNPKTTVFVGANNSGKTSAIAALGTFLVNPGNFTTNDFTLSNWKLINDLGIEWEASSNEADSGMPESDIWESALPCLDLWLDVADDEIHYISHMLPTLDWAGGLLGIRLRLEPDRIEELRREFLAAVRAARDTLKIESIEPTSPPRRVALWPRTMRDFLDRRLRSVLTVRAYSLDPSKQVPPESGLARPQPLPPGSKPIQDDNIRRLIQIDMIHAQRELADVVSTRNRVGSAAHGATHSLSSQLRSYYDNHLNPSESPEPSDLDALEAIQGAEKQFDERLKAGFAAALEEVEKLGYPGFSDPKITIATKIRLTDGLNHDAAVQYDVLPFDAAGSGQFRLPENYNGLGYQNLISMVFELMSFRDGWMQVGKAAKKVEADPAGSFFPPPLHLVLIEEPEAHLHAQVQQVFIRKAYELLRNHSNLGQNTKLLTQLVVSTHSSHVAHECEFAYLRYFRRQPASGANEVPIATVVNLSEVFGDTSDTQRFVTRYLKATHCDLFFADAAILVEGPAERILVPQFVREQFPELNQRYLTLLEIGGSHAHRLRPLIEHLGLTTLVVTDIDASERLLGSAVPPARGKEQVTRNATLKQWLPKIDSLDALLNMKSEEKIKSYDPFFSVRVAYQCPLKVQLMDDQPQTEAIPNTFEDALVYDNLRTFKNLESIGSIRKFKEAVEQSATAAELEMRMFKILKDAKKAEFALDLLVLEQEPWPIKSPSYIFEGLSWLQEQMRRKQKEILAPNPPSGLPVELSS